MSEGKDLKDEQTSDGASVAKPKTLAWPLSPRPSVVGRSAVAQTLVGHTSPAPPEVTAWLNALLKLEKRPSGIAGSLTPALEPPATPEPQVTAVEPQAAVVEPQAIAAEPQVTAVEPQAAVVEPQAIAAEPQAIAVAPQATAVEQAIAVEPPPPAALPLPDAALVTDAALVADTAPPPPLAALPSLPDAALVAEAAPPAPPPSLPDAALVAEAAPAPAPPPLEAALVADAAPVAEAPPVAETPPVAEAPPPPPAPSSTEAARPAVTASHPDAAPVMAASELDTEGFPLPTGDRRRVVFLALIGVAAFAITFGVIGRRPRPDAAATAPLVAEPPAAPAPGLAAPAPEPAAPPTLAAPAAPAPVLAAPAPAAAPTPEPAPPTENVEEARRPRHHARREQDGAEDTPYRRGLAYEKEGKVAQAMEAFKEAMAQAKRTSERERIARRLYNLAHLNDGAEAR